MAYVIQSGHNHAKPGEPDKIYWAYFESLAFGVMKRMTNDIEKAKRYDTKAGANLEVGKLFRKGKLVKIVKFTPTNT